MWRVLSLWVVVLGVLGGGAFGVWRWQVAHAAPEITYKSTPVEKKRSIEGPAVARSERCVTNRGPFSEKMKSSGVSSCQRRKLAGFCEP